MPIPDHNVVRKLGSGGFGDTTLIEMKGQPYVLKRLKQNMRSPLAMRLFQNEAKHLSVLGIHPQIPTLQDIGEDDDGYQLKTGQVV